MRGRGLQCLSAFSGPARQKSDGNKEITCVVSSAFRRLVVLPGPLFLRAGSQFPARKVSSAFRRLVVLPADIWAGSDRDYCAKWSPVPFGV